MTAALEGGEWSAARPGRTLPPGKTRYPLYRRLGELQGRSGREENLAPTGIRSPEHSAHSQALYRPIYPVHFMTCNGPNLPLLFQINLRNSLPYSHKKQYQARGLWGGDKEFLMHILKFW